MSIIIILEDPGIFFGGNLFCTRVQNKFDIQGPNKEFSETNGTDILLWCSLKCIVDRYLCLGLALYT